MPSLYRRVFGVIAVTLCFAAAAFAQQPVPEQAFVAEKGFRSRIFEIRNLDPNILFPVLEPLGSGFKGATMRANRDFRTLTVRDFPENIASIEEALQRLDTPRASAPGIELRVHVLIASNVDGAVNQPPAELKGVLQELQSTLDYKNYYLVGSQIHRVAGNPDHFQPVISGSGSSQLAQPLIAVGEEPTLNYSYVINSIAVRANSSGSTAVQLNGFNFTSGNRAGNPSIRTSVNLRDGEKAVVGTASFKDKTLILILSTRVIA